MQYFNKGDHLRYKESVIDHYDTEVFGDLAGLVFIVTGYYEEDGHELKDYLNLKCLTREFFLNGVHHSELELVAEA